MTTGLNAPASLFPTSGSASPEFMVPDEESISICPLLTPSPTADFPHPLQLSATPVLGYERQLSPSSVDTEISTLPASINAANDFADLSTENTPQPNDKVYTGRILGEHGGLEGSSSSSSCSVMQDSTTAASAQLLNHHFLNLAAAADPSGQENGGLKTVPLVGLSKAAQEYGFVKWNWNLIRKWCFWGVMSITVACVCVIIGYITTIPNKCDPPRAWHQGALIYQVFPASFQDSDSNGIGDLAGITSRVGYFEKLGVRGVRLSYLFPAQHYPEHYEDITNLTRIEKTIGTLNDFRVLVESLHRKNISVIIDLPIYPFFTELRNRDPDDWQDRESVKHVIVNNHILISATNKTHVVGADRGEITDVLSFWLNFGVDGFYMMGLEHFINDDKFSSQILEWKAELNKYNQEFDKILVCSYDVIKFLQELTVSEGREKLNVLLKSFDLVDIMLEPFTEGTRSIKRDLDMVQGGILYTKPGLPWPYWTLGGMTTRRLATKAPYGNVSIAAILASMMLPGSSGIFYGDEIGLEDIHDPGGERVDLEHVHQLGPMHWSDTSRSTGFSQYPVHPWLPVSRARLSLSATLIFSAMSSIRDSNPGLYMHAIWKNDELIPNTAIRYVDNNMITIERTYPRRHGYLLVANLGFETVAQDLSSHYYGGMIVLDFWGKQSRYTTFHSCVLQPGEVFVAKLDK